VENRINKVEPLLYELSNIYQNESWDEVETFISQKGIRIQKDRRIRVVVEFNVSDINSFVEGIKYLGVRPQRVQRKDLQIQKLPEVQYVRFPTKDEIDAVSEATALIQINDEIKKNQARANKKIE
jgi:adenylate cyclase class IV